MPRLVHLAPEPLHRRIERSGLRGTPWVIPATGGKVSMKEAIFAMPSFRDEQITYQWLRELRSWLSGGRLIAVTFEVSDSAEVFYGRFGKTKKSGSPHAARTGIEADPWGSEVVLNGPVSKDQIVSVRSVRQDIGWQGTPEPSSHEDCACPACLPSGHPKFMRRVRGLFNGGIERIHAASGDPDIILNELCHMAPAFERGRERLTPKRLLSLTVHADNRVRAEIAGLLGYFRWSDVEEHAAGLLLDLDKDVRARAIGTVLRKTPPAAALALMGDHPARLSAFCEGLEYSSDGEADAVLKGLLAHDHVGVRAAAKVTLARRTS